MAFFTQQFCQQTLWSKPLVQKIQMNSSTSNSSRHRYSPHVSVRLQKSAAAPGSQMVMRQLACRGWGSLVRTSEAMPQPTGGKVSPPTASFLLSRCLGNRSNTGFGVPSQPERGGDTNKRRPEGGRGGMKGRSLALLIISLQLPPPLWILLEVTNWRFTRANKVRGEGPQREKPSRKI